MYLKKHNVNIYYKNQYRFLDVLLSNKKTFCLVCFAPSQYSSSTYCSENFLVHSDIIDLLDLEHNRLNRYTFKEVLLITCKASFLRYLK